MDDPDERQRAVAAERTARKPRAAKRLGWVLTNDGVEVRAERRVTIGPRTIVIRGRVPIDVPAEMTAEAAAMVIDPIVDPAVEQFEHAMNRAVQNILSAPDDVETTRTFDRPSFFSALEEARRGLLELWRTLETRRLNERVEAELGLRFYLEGFASEQLTFEFFVGPTNSGKTHAALEVLASEPSGVYLAPLRLLALEVYERLVERGVRTSLASTGEELRDRSRSAAH